MFKRLSIQGLRGIREGTLDELAPLTVLVGRNGQGKSTVLEAAFLLALAPDLRALVQVVRRRGWWGLGAWDCLRPVTGRASAAGEVFSVEVAGVVARGGGDSEVRGTASVSRTVTGKLGQMARQLGFEPVLEVRLELRGDRTGTSAAAVGPDGRMTATVAHHAQTCLDVATLLDAPYMLQHGGVESLLSESTTGGWLDAAVRQIKRVADGLADLRLVGSGGETVAMLYFGNGRPSIPVYVAGDGVRRIIEMALATLGGPPGIVIVEEPENFLHPGARAVCAEILWSAAARGEQVLVSTHSLDLLDDLLEPSDRQERDLTKLAVFRTSLADGVLSAERFSGADASEAREILGHDLRV